MSEATSARPVSTAASVSQPYACVFECGLPYDSTRNGIIASSTRGSIGVVACAMRNRAKTCVRACARARERARVRGRWASEYR